jgi:hypothetical protein
MGLAWLIYQKQMIDTLRYNGEDVSRWRELLHSDVDCYDKTNAESILLGVVTELQANDLLVADFGHLSQRIVATAPAFELHRAPARGCRIETGCLS